MLSRLVERAAFSAFYTWNLRSRLRKEQVLVQSESALVFLVPVVLVEARVSLTIYSEVRPGTERAVQRDSQEAQRAGAAYVVLVRALGCVAGQSERGQGGFVELRDVD